MDKILDNQAGPKGTGKWTGIYARTGIPLSLIVEAVFEPWIIALKEERVNASQVLKGPQPLIPGDKNALLNDLHDALYASKIISYTQGYMLMRAAAEEYHWNLNYGGVALMWRGGCIIRSAFLGKIKQASIRIPVLRNLLQDPYFKTEVGERPGRLAARDFSRGAKRHSPARHVQRPVFLRCLPARLAAGQPAAGPARLFRRAHLRPPRPAARPVLPH